MISYSIIIPNYNGAKLLEECLNSLSQAIFAYPDIKYEIILVDNDSTDDSLNIFSNVLTENIASKAIILGKNTGFANAVNRGIESAKYEYIVVCNNDLTVKKNWFKIISSAVSQNHNVTCFCSTVLNKSGKLIESQGMKFYYSGKCTLINHNIVFHKSYIINHKSGSVPVWGAPASLVVYKKEILQKIGLFDPNYFAFLEDVDLSFRLQQHHQTTLLVPMAISYHQGGVTADKNKLFRPRLTFRNWHYFILKNYKPSEIIKYFPQIFIERLHNLSYLVRSILNLI